MTEAIAILRAWLQGRIDDGVICPCCDQFAKVYRRSISGPMVLTLIAMYHVSREREGCSNGLGPWIHIERDINDAGRTAKRSRDYAKLRHWGLIEPHPHNAAARPDKSSAGLWRITSPGVNYVEGDLCVPKYALVYNNEGRGFDGDILSIEDSLGKNFNYGELMRAHRELASV